MKITVVTRVGPAEEGGNLAVEILVLDDGGREIAGRGRAPGKWDVTIENVGIHMHEAPGFLDPELGPCVTLDRHSDAPLLGEFDGVASDGSRCQAITLERERCPKRGAVAIIVNEAWVHLCGTHIGTHRAGDRLVEAVIVAYSDAHIPIRCVRCGHETRWHVDGACACEGDGVAGLCPCQEPKVRASGSKRERWQHS